MQEALDLEAKTAEEILTWARDEYKEKVALASSFGAEDVVLVDMMVKIWREKNLEPVIFTLDTGRLPQETYEVMDEIREKYNLKIKCYFPQKEDVEKMIEEHGFNLFYKSIELRKLCCNIRKVRPLARALSSLSAWICGLRKEQSPTRSNIKKVEIDTAHNNILKINPLVDWKEDEVWKYIKENNIPYNKLHDKNYPSIGCAPCTRAVKPGEDIRAGRWWWEAPEHKECGLHPSKKC